VSCAKTVVPVEIQSGKLSQVGPGIYVLDGVHVAATWRIRLNRVQISVDATDRLSVDSLCAACCNLVAPPRRWERRRPPGDGRGGAPMGEPAVSCFLIH